LIDDHEMLGKSDLPGKGGFLKLPESLGFFDDPGVFAERGKIKKGPG
jgi:hypothetical protein